jgi:hypothetical protein
MFAATCRAEIVLQFRRFLHLVASTDWSVSPLPPLRIEHHVRYSWSAAIFNSLDQSHRSYI